MRAFRRRLASFTLALTAVQFALLFAAPVSACCARQPIAVRTSAEAKDCCPAGSHPPGECPLHKDQVRKSSGPQTSAADHCRMMCDAPHGPQIVFGAIGVLPPPAVSDITFTWSPFQARTIAHVAAPAAFPAGPPPKSL
jgi:hypothetical protein